MSASQLSGWRRVRCLAVLTAMLAVPALLGATATANPTSVTAGSGSAVVTGASPVALTFPLERAGDLLYDTWVQYETQDGTAVADVDYEGTSGSLLIPAGETEANIPVQALGASAYSPDKQFTLQLRAVGVGPTPSFAAPQGFATGEGSNSVATADVNGDGKRDLLVANASDDTFSVLLNTTAAGAAVPAYSPEQTFAAGRGPRSALAADVNGDGRPDLIVVNNQIDERAVSVFLNTTGLGSSTASFAARQVVTTGDNPFQVQAADLNGDGRPDLVFGNGANDDVSVLMNTTETGAMTPSFAPRQSFAAGEGTFSPRATDLNGDGRPDLVVVNNAAQGKQAVSVLLNTTAPGASVPSFAAPSEFPVQGASPRSVATTDFNGDGRLDLAVASWGTPWLSVLLNTTAPGADTPSFAPQHVVPGLPSGFKEWVSSDDFNGDGKPDLALVSLGGATVSVLFNTTPPGAVIPSFSSPQNINSAEFTFLAWIGATDVNGDGRPDLLVANDAITGKVSVLLNTTAAPTATPSFATEQPFATGDAPAALDTTDVNGDGRADLLVANHGAVDLSVLLDTQYAAAVIPASVTGTIHYAIPQVSLDPSSLPFGEQLMGSSSSTTVTLANTGGEELVVTGIAIDGPDADQLGQANDCPDALPVGSSCSIVITYAPSAAATAAAELTVTTDAPTSPDAVALSGTGYSSPPPLHTLAVGLVGDGAGTVATASGAISCPPACSQSFVAGTQVQLTANPAPGSTFAGWSGGCAGAGTCQLTLAADTTLVARFKKAAPAPARLRIRRVRPQIAGAKVKVVVAGTITKAARGVVRVALGARLDGRRLSATARAPIRDGRWRARLPFAGLDAGGAVTIKASASFKGSPGVDSARAKRRTSFGY